jgi:GTP-binding protein Era
MGIVNGDDFQIVYSDTPGIVRSPSYKMHEYMNKYIDSALLDADIMLLMTEPGIQFQENDILEKIKKSAISIIVIINKIDLSDQAKIVEEITYWEELLPGSTVIPISALEAFNIEKVFDQILQLLPDSPAYYDKEVFTDRSMRFFVSEIIREKILLNYKKEIPYEVEVAVELYKDEEKFVRITVLIFVSCESQKAILLGHQGNAIKKTATQARKDIESFIGKKVFLETTIKVRKDWRDNENILKHFGYDH